MSNLLPDASLQDIRDELMYTEGLVDALDESCDSYVERKFELDTEIQNLEQRYMVKQAEQETPHDDNDDDDDEVMRIFRGTNGSSPTGQLNSWAGPQTPVLDGNENNSLDFDSILGAEHISHAGGNGGNREGRPDNSASSSKDWTFADLDELYPTAGAQTTRESLSSTSSLPQRSAGSSPAFAQLPNRKRPRDSLAVNNKATGQPDAKALRYTPSPAVTAPTTPSSLESLDLPDDPEFIRLTGGNPKGDMEDFRQAQKDIMKMIEQERKSAELAKKLAEKQTSRRRLYQPSSQAVLNFDGKGFQPLVSARAPTDADIRSDLPKNTQVKHDYQSDYNVPSPYVKQERRSKAGGDTLPQHMSGGFIDLGSDSSDLEEIEARDFQGDNKQSQTRADTAWPGVIPDYTSMAPSNGFATRASWSDIEQLDASNSWPDPLPDAYGQSSVSANISYPSYNGFGGTNVYGTISDAPQQQNPSWLSSTAGMIGQGFASAAQDVKNAAYSILDGHINTYPGALPGYGGVGAPGSSTNPHVVGNASGMNIFGFPQQYSINSALPIKSEQSQDLRGQELHPNYWDRYDYLTNDPTRTREEIKSLLENIRPDEDLPENREGDPEAMKYPLMPHQKLGLTWMKNMEEGSNKGGILADDMGLGKTIQALALMVSRKSPDPARKTNLVVAPVALMKQWEREIQKKLKNGPHALTTYILHGAKRDTTFADLKKYDVVLTTFGTLANEVKRKEGIDYKKRVNPNWRPSGRADRLPLLGDECKWYR